MVLGENKTVTENSRSLNAARKIKNLSMIHEARWRQLPTNHNHASLSAVRRITREYQNDSPSINLFPPGLQFCRAGPKRNRVDRLVHIREIALPIAPPYIAKGLSPSRKTQGDPSSGVAEKIGPRRGFEPTTFGL